jgi:hypothetical protein
VTVLDDEARAKIEADLTEARTPPRACTTEQAAASQHFHAQQEQSRIVAELTKLATIAQCAPSHPNRSRRAGFQAKTASDHAKQQRTQREPIWEKAAGMAAQSDQLEKQLSDSRATYQTWAKDQKEAATRREALRRKRSPRISMPRRRWKLG